MPTPPKQIPRLELALMRRGLEDAAAGSERCARCQRTPLIGERVYPLPSGLVVCELCRKRRREVLSEWRLVHGPAFGHTIRVVDQRGAGKAWHANSDEWLAAEREHAA
jgi:hypothetical protein